MTVKNGRFYKKNSMKFSLVKLLLQSVSLCSYLDANFLSVYSQTKFRKNFPTRVPFKS